MTYDILFSLQKMIGDKCGLVRQTILKIIITTKMMERIFIKDHMVCMIGPFNEMKIIEVKINGETKAHMILEILLDSFKYLSLTII